MNQIVEQLNNGGILAASGHIFNSKGQNLNDKMQKFEKVFMSLIMKKIFVMTYANIVCNLIRFIFH